jgi:GntR family transcriptional regulator/MocR family aminotransferase
MSKRTTTFDLTLPPRSPDTPAYRWLCAVLRNEILEGRLRPGARLPATRDLAQQHGLSRGTIVGAFEQLKSEGYIEGSVGSGTYVNKILPEELLQVPRKASVKPAVHRPPPRQISDFSKRVTLFPACAFASPVRAFRANQPALDLFPTTLWAQVAARRLRGSTPGFLLGCGAMGYRPLQEALADYLTTSRGVKCVPDQIMVVSGVQEALDLVGRVFLNPGDRVAMENPGYLGAALVFEALGAKIAPVRVDDEGMEVPAPQLKDIRLTYITPAHQFPLGIGMSLCRRLELLKWARNSGSMIFEDDYDSEFRYSGRPVPALQGLDQDGVVLFAGSLSKVLFPSIRMGYLVVPPDLVDYFAAARSVTSRHAPLPEQAILADFMTEGHFGRHIRRMREVYAERRCVLLENARERLAGLVDIDGVEAGLQTAGYLRAGIKGEAAVEAAAKREVEVLSLSRYCRGRVEREGLKLGFAASNPTEIRRGVRELAAALEGLATASRS